MINMRWDNSRCLDHMKLSDKNQVLLAPLCSARAIGTRFVAIPEKQVTLEVKTHPSTPSRNYTGLNLAFTGYVNEIRCDLGEMFLCQKTGVCISKTLLCDQVDHCGDRSDEPQDCDTNTVPWSILCWHTSHQTTTRVGGPVGAANATNEKTKEFLFF
ncbi:secreted protein, putative [Ixodes scapularis]|uniref:Secreted protein, putative n=1 Tax=Ixodes scapularis TaxID=6945 RepID=B7P3K7_IXOSC|nr:secreted protein, putative [Ixodes scapularis]|eukprot:XP_002404340.1 secreted protein, putative [Ixodes scapularis]